MADKYWFSRALLDIDDIPVSCIICASYRFYFRIMFLYIDLVTLHEHQTALRIITYESRVHNTASTLLIT